MPKPTPKQDSPELLQGTLEVMLLRTLRRGPNHGYGLARAIELARVYPFPAPTVAADNVAPPATPTTTGATVALEAQIAGLREVGELLRRQLDDVREDRDRWRGQAERLALTRPPPSRSWWRRLAG